MADKGKPFMIQAYNNTDNSLLNKYKFVLIAKTVAQLKQKIVEKLESKNQLAQEDKVIIKDTGDFELGSDDEIDDVLPDCKLRIYISKPNAKPNPPAEEKKDKQASNLAIIPPSSVSVPAVVNPPSPLVSTNNQSQQNIPANNLGTRAAVDVPIVNLTGWTVPQVPENYPKDKIWTVICPQIRKTQFQLEAIDNISFYQLSRYVIKKFNLSESLKALIYTYEGQPLLFNLDLIHFTIPKLDHSKAYYIIFTATNSPSADALPAEPMEISSNCVDVKVQQGQEKMTFNIDLGNSLSVLKHRIFKKTGIPPANQIIKFANNTLTNDSETLQGCNIKPDSILTLEFKVISNIIPSTYADKFFYKDVQLLNSQDIEAYRAFKSNILALGHHLSQTDKQKFISFIRSYTNNEPLVCALRTLFYKAFLSQAHRIALEQGFYAATWHYLKASNPPPHTQVQFLFNHIRHFIGFVFQAISNATFSDAEFAKREETILLTKTCQLTTKNIKTPALIKLDDGSTVLIDKEQMIDQINKGYVFPLLKQPKKEQIFQINSLFDNWEIFNQNSYFSPSPITVALWLGADQKDLPIATPRIQLAEKYQSVITTKYPDLKVHMPLEIKNKSSIYLILLNKENQHRIFVSKNKDINRPHNVFDVITGKQEGVNLDLMMAAGKTENLEEQVDISSLKPVITREPKEAIVVLFDISGSMGGKFFNEADLKRIGACKLFFEALAYRTIAYNFEHVVSLVFFDHNIEIQCDFTQAIYDFNRLVSAAVPRGSTLLYDSIVKAVNQLLEFKKRYPECILRILALTDGQDTGSIHSIFDATKSVIINNIVIDSFAVGANCQGLKTITIASGGKCYLTRNMEESLKLFEQETVLSVRARKIELEFFGNSDEQIRLRIEKAKLKPFDFGNNVHEFKLPEIKGPGLNLKEVAQKYSSEEGQKKISGNASLKRIAKQIQLYNENPHPFVAIFPCENINVWRILLLGPKETPYENGLFLLYANFPGNYPFKAPQIRFITPIYHCNMNQQGRICHSVFDRNYSPALTFRHIVDCIYGLILTPEPDDPLDNVVASFFLSDYPTYLVNAKEATLKNASKTPEELVEQIYGKITDDIERQKKIVEIKQWIEKAKSFN